jgi:hypothetical protein
MSLLFIEYKYSYSPLYVNGVVDEFISRYKVTDSFLDTEVNIFKTSYSNYL